MMHGPLPLTSAFHRPLEWVETALSQAEVEPGVYDRAGMHPTVEAALDAELARGPHAFAPMWPDAR